MISVQHRQRVSERKEDNIELHPIDSINDDNGSYDKLETNITYKDDNYKQPSHEVMTEDELKVSEIPTSNKLPPFAINLPASDGENYIDVNLNANYGY